MKLIQEAHQHVMFENCYNLQTVIIPDDARIILDCVFYNCEKLQSIVLPRHMHRIGNSAFHGCPKLTSIDIPASVTSIGGGAFSGCSNLGSLIIPDTVTNMGGFAINECKRLRVLRLPPHKHGNVDAEYGVSVVSVDTCPNLVLMALPVQEDLLIKVPRSIFYKTRLSTTQFELFCHDAPTTSTESRDVKSTELLKWLPYTNLAFQTSRYISHLDNKHVPNSYHRWILNCLLCFHRYKDVSLCVELYYVILQYIQLFYS